MPTEVRYAVVNMNSTYSRSYLPQPCCCRFRHNMLQTPRWFQKPRASSLLLYITSTRLLQRQVAVPFSPCELLNSWATGCATNTGLDCEVQPGSVPRAPCCHPPCQPAELAAPACEFWTRDSGTRKHEFVTEALIEHGHRNHILHAALIAPICPNGSSTITSSMAPKKSGLQFSSY